MIDDEETDAEREKRFLQPIEDIELVSLQPGPRVPLTIEEINDARRRVELGEDPEAVAEELAIVKVSEEEFS